MDLLDRFIEGGQYGVVWVMVHARANYRVRDYHANAIAFQDQVPITAVIEHLTTIGERVAWARKQRRLTQQQLATSAGVAQSTIGSLESGQRSKPRELNSIARALGASALWLETGEGNWEEGSKYSGGVEASFAAILHSKGVVARKLTAADTEHLPDWLRFFRGPDRPYLPDLEIQVPGRQTPLYVEVNSMLRPGHPLADQFKRLQLDHPSEFIWFYVDSSEPDLGLKRFFEQSRLPIEHEKPASQVRAAEPAPSYGMAPILAWEHPDDLPEGEFVMIPRLDVHLSAGNGHEQVEIDLVKDNPQAFRSEWIRLMRLKPAKLAAMRASGDSMEPTIHDGDSLLVDTSQTNVVDGKVYALWYDGGERVKRLFRLPGGGLRIVSDNARFPTVEVPPGYTEHVRVIGRIVHRSGTGGL